MVDSGSLDSVLASQTGTSWTGRVYRVMVNDFPPNRENNGGARWNPPDTAAMYTCLEPSVCIAEVEYGLKRQSRSVKPGLRRTLYELEVSLSSVLDLAPLLPALADIGIEETHLFADDMKISQEIGRLATWYECDGLLVPSARSTGANLVIYPGRTVEGYRFEVVGQKAL